MSERVIHLTEDELSWLIRKSSEQAHGETVCVAWGSGALYVQESNKWAMRLLHERRLAARSDSEDTPPVTGTPKGEPNE